MPGVEVAYPSMSIDAEANAATLRLRTGTTSRSERVHRSLVADYDVSGQLTRVELLSLAAIARDGVLTTLRELVQGLEPAPEQGNNVTPLRSLQGWVDLFVQQVGEALALRQTATAASSSPPKGPALSISWG